MASLIRKKEAVFFFLTASLIFRPVVRADVTVGVGLNCQSFSMTNATPLPWKIGGIRFFDHTTFWTSASDGEGSGWTMIHATVGGRIQQDLYFKSVAMGIVAPSGSKLLPAATATFNRSYNTETDVAYPDMYVLLRTGAPGIPDDPTDADPLTLSQLDSVSNVASFYSPSYRYSYTDSLGVNGGKYSGGFIDTWYNRAAGKAETQIQFPIPAASFTVNGTSVNFVPTGMNQYWMSLAVGQEYLHADMQWMAAQGAKETGIGTSFPVAATNQAGVYGFWQIENATGLDRALSYPGFFPKYSAQLARALDVTTSGINSDAFMTYYTRGTLGQTPVNSALILNSCLMSIISQYVNYYICACATDICWMNSLAIAVDPYMGVSYMAVMYNVGQWSTIGNVVALLNPNVYQQTCANPTARTLMGTGNMNYVPDILNVVQTEVNASRQFEKNNANLTLVDFQITERSLWDMFFGDNGTVTAQGNGGLLLHYYDPAAGNFTAVRQQIWNTLDTAFNRLKGRAPTASATTISFRYDFLAVLRTVKDKFPFLRQKQPNSGDAATLIPAYSGHYGACSGTGASDETYPYLGTSSNVNGVGDMAVYDTVTDETLAKSVKWTLDYNWVIWNDAVARDTSNPKRKIFSFTALKADIDNYRLQPDGQSGHFVWIMASDASGNSIFKKIAVAGNRYPNLDSAIIQDVNGDGLGDKITAFLTRSAADSSDQIGSFSNFRYSWPLQAPPGTPVLVGNAAVTAIGNTLVYSTLPASPGAGLGTVLVTYPSKPDISAGLLDRIGPALTTATSKTSQGATAPDTLLVAVTEPIRNLIAAGAAYLNFKKFGTTTKTPVASTSVVKQGATGASWVFIFPTGTLAAWDSVDFVTTPGLILDTVGNPPLDINRMVRIQKQGDRFPTLDSAIIQDVNGDGIGDKITVFLTLSTADSADPIDSFRVFQYSWPQQTPLVPIAKNLVMTSGSTLIYSNVPAGPGAGLGSVALDYKSGSGLTTNLLDRIGPAVTSASSKATKNATVQDTLTVTPSEPIQNLGTINTAYLNFKKAGTTTKTPVASISVVNSGNSITWVFILPGGTIAAYDSVNFATASGLVLDAVENPPLDINRMVAIQKQSLVVSLARLTITAVPDTGTILAGDSLVLSARVYDDTGGVRPEYGSLITWSPLSPAGSKNSLRTQTGANNTFYAIDAYKTYTIAASFPDPANASRILSDSMRISVVPGKAYRIVIEADTIANRNTATPDTVVTIDRTTNSDTVFAVLRDAFGNFCGLSANAQWSSAAAAIASAAAAPGRNYAGIVTRVTDGTTTVMATEAGLVPDTIRVVIAPAVLTALRLVNTVSGDTVLAIAMKNDQKMTLKLIGTMSNSQGLWIPVKGTWSMTPQNLVLSVPLPTDTTSSWILSPTSAGQATLTVSSGAMSVTVPVKVTALIRIAGTIVCDNPFVPGVSQVPSLNGLPPAIGTRIEVQLSAPPVDNLNDTLIFGNITIFDAVGNVVTDNTGLLTDRVRKSMYFIWDGKNKRGTRVAAGNYLGKIEVFNRTDNTVAKTKTLIGVK